jgi:hypothetical protein
MKKTNTWLLRYSQPSFKTHDPRTFPSETTDVKSGTYPTLLKNRTIIPRRADKTKGEEPMPIPMINTVEFEGKRYSAIHLDIPKKEFDDKKYFSEDEWAKCEKDKAIVKFAQKHLQTSYTDATGKQLNNNFYVEDQPYYILTDLDSKSEQIAENDQKIKRLGYELALTYQSEDKTEFINLCYLMGVNPTNTELGTLYNILVTKIEEDPERFDKIIDNPDRWYRIVLNKALRTLRPNTSPAENYISESSEGQYINYYMEGKHIATGYDALIGYFKDNSEMFSFLEIELELKKKEQKDTGSVETVQPLSLSSPETPKRRGRPAKQTQE